MPIKHLESVSPLSLSWPERVTYPYPTSLPSREEAPPNAPSQRPLRLPPGHRCRLLSHLSLRQPTIARASSSRHRRTPSLCDHAHRERPPDARKIAHQARLCISRHHPKQAPPTHAARHRAARGVSRPQPRVEQVRVGPGGGRHQAVRGAERPRPLGPLAPRPAHFSQPKRRIYRRAVRRMGTGALPVLSLGSETELDWHI
ncbi:hypothetical protein BC827DRAFT_592451 [Russula dissimulans]|nr:hypothetical protein BC827DRAFT_592451 [Russula dissimulans]